MGHLQKLGFLGRGIPKSWDGASPNNEILGWGIPKSWDGASPKAGMGHPQKLGWGIPKSWDGSPQF